MSEPQVLSSIQRLSIHPQQGAVLVVVLFIMVLIATASLIALRGSKTALDLTATFQINQLLAQASDTPLLYLAKQLRDSQQLVILTAEQGPIGYLTQEGSQYALAEYTFCYRPMLKGLVYNVSEPAKITSDNGQPINPKSYCNIANNQRNHFISDRKIIATQLSFVRLNAPATETLGLGSASSSALIAAGNDTQISHTKGGGKSHTATPFAGNLGEDLKGNEHARIRVYVTSVMPSFSRSSLSEIDACLAKPIARTVANSSGLGATENQVSCLERTATPFNLQVQDYVYSLKTVPN